MKGKSMNEVEQEPKPQEAAVEIQLYPISETFTAPQGEGLYAGTTMFFIRLAGCSVGRKIVNTDERLAWGAREGLAVLPDYREVCQAWDGRGFLCDTDFRVKERLSIPELLARKPGGVRHVCITGGEPLIHDLTDLILACWRCNLVVHVETSGTIALRLTGVQAPAHYRSQNGLLWITVSPKKGTLPEMLSLADEIKLLVDKDFDVDAAKRLVYGTHYKTDRIVYIQPINQEWALNPGNIERCIAIQKEMPEWRISVQVHKVLHTR